MSLIPRGPHQGKVLVWDQDPIIGEPPTGPTNPPTLWTYQAYSIVDPSPTIPSGSVRFRNYLLPIGPAQPGPIINGVQTFQGGDIFCSGHCWSIFGDLVVVGGTVFRTDPAGGYTYLAADTTFVFSPTEPSTNYAGDFGRWFQGPQLDNPRWYPTATLTGPIPHLGGRHAIAVLGGDSVVGGSPAQQHTWNSYEAMDVVKAADPLTAPQSGIQTDSFTSTSGASTTWPGPGTHSGGHPYIPSQPALDSFQFYPRTHLLTNGRLFMSGFVPFSSNLDHETTTWSPVPGHAFVPSNWNQLREYGASVRYPNIGGEVDLVLRLGGDDFSSFGPITTNTVESCNARDSSSDWKPMEPMKYPRSVFNVVVLPDASLLAIGGRVMLTSTTSAHEFKPEIYRPGSTSWEDLPMPFSARDYHSAAILLPDGRVLVGGGDDRIDDRTGGTNGTDYEVFLPPYLVTGGGAIPIRPENIAFAASVPTEDQGRVTVLTHGANFTVTLNALPLGTSIERVVLMAPGSTTHHSDMHQRYHALVTKHLQPTSVQFTTPLNATVLPAGYYMLYLVTNTGIPSVARWIRL